LTPDGRPLYQVALKEVEDRLVARAEAKWKKTYGRFAPGGGQFGRTTILPALFADWRGTGFPLNTSWRQNILVAGEQRVLSGRNAGWTLPEDFMVAWVGLAFPNKEMTITELRWEIGQTKYGRVNIEEMRGYNTPALIFRKGFEIGEEESIEIMAYVEEAGYQSIVPLGFQLNQQIDRVLGLCGSAIT
jgi:hypothetical protein